MPPKIQLPKVKDLDQLITEEIEKIAKEFVARVQNNIIEEKLTDRGTLLKSIKILNISPTEKDVVSTDAKAIYIEKGRAPGTFPPILPLQEWIMRKGIGGGEIKTPQDLKAARRLLRKNPKKIAFMIAQKIKKEGIEAKPFWEPAIDWIEKKRAEKSIKKIGKKILEKIK